MKGNYGNLETLKELGKTKKYSYTEEQLLNHNLTNLGGECYIEVIDRFNKFFNELYKLSEKNINIAVVSHGAAIKFFLSQYCSLNSKVQLEYNGKALNISSPSVFKLEIKKNNITNIDQIY